MKLYPKWRWWKRGDCVVEVLKAGHFPTTAMVRLPNGVVTEVEINDLENPDGRDTRSESQTAG